MVKSDHYTVGFAQEGFISVRANQTLLEAALSAGIPLLHECNGNARCSTCRVLVLAGGKALNLPQVGEQELANQMNLLVNVRLACQTRVHGDGVNVCIILRDRTDIDLYVGPPAVEACQDLRTEKELVLLFLDIRDFTHLVETHLAFDVIHIIRKLFTAFQIIINQNGGKVIESAGDSLYIVFGLDQDLSRSAAAAIDTGYALLAELRRLNEKYFQKYFNQNISIGIGIHQGLVISGTIRLGDEQHWAVMGYPVNIASRLQSATKDLNNDFIVSSAVTSLLPNSVTEAEPVTISLRGVSEALSVFLLGEPYAYKPVISFSFEVKTT